MDRESALKAKSHALQAVEQLTLLLNAIVGGTPEAELEPIRKSVGLAIGRIQTEILDPIYRQFPDIDDLN